MEVVDRKKLRVQEVVRSKRLNLYPCSGTGRASSVGRSDCGDLLSSGSRRRLYAQPAASRGEHL